MYYISDDIEDPEFNIPGLIALQPLSLIIQSLSTVDTCQDSDFCVCEWCVCVCVCVCVHARVVNKY